MYILTLFGVFVKRKGTPIAECALIVLVLTERIELSSPRPQPGGTTFFPSSARLTYNLNVHTFAVVAVAGAIPANTH